MRRIDFENHFATSGWIEALYSNKDYPRMVDDKETGSPFLWYGSDVSQPFGGVLPSLLDLDRGRIHHMDANGLDVAVLSVTAPCVEQFDPIVGVKVAADVNNTLAEAVQRHPARFVGFAVLAPKDAPAAVVELERAVKELGFRGWFTHSNFGDSYLDEKRYWPILAKAEELDVPVYIHPTVPMIKEMRTYGLRIAGASFGFGTEAALVMLRLIVSGVFDAFPRLQVMLGHLGEGLPFMLNRVDRPYLQGHVAPDPRAPEIEYRPSHYLTHNLVISTSGNYLPAAFECARRGVGMERIVLGTDYPFETTSECLEFLDAQGLSESERASLFEGNALRLGVDSIRTGASPTGGS